MPNNKFGIESNNTRMLYNIRTCFELPHLFRPSPPKCERRFSDGGQTKSGKFRMNYHLNSAHIWLTIPDPVFTTREAACSCARRWDKLKFVLQNKFVVKKWFFPEREELQLLHCTNRSSLTKYSINPCLTMWDPLALPPSGSAYLTMSISKMIARGVARARSVLPHVVRQINHISQIVLEIGSSTPWAVQNNEAQFEMLPVKFCSGMPMNPMFRMDLVSPRVVCNMAPLTQNFGFTIFIARRSLVYHHAKREWKAECEWKAEFLEATFLLFWTRF